MDTAQTCILAYILLHSYDLSHQGGWDHTHIPINVEHRKEQLGIVSKIPFQGYLATLHSRTIGPGIADLHRIERTIAWQR